MGLLVILLYIRHFSITLTTDVDDIFSWNRFKRESEGYLGGLLTKKTVATPKLVNFLFVCFFFFFFFFEICWFFEIGP